MYRIYVKYKDEVHMRVICEETSVEFEIRDYFSFFVANYRFHPKFKARLWNGKINLYSRSNKELYRGLLTELIKFCIDRKYQMEIDPVLLEKNEITEEALSEFLSTITKYTYWDHQLDAIHKAIKNNRLLLLSPTSSGKSLIQYSILRYYNVKSLVIVPKINLVNQLKTDFQDYAKGTDWIADENCHEIYSGKEKASNKKIVISTWQSLHKMSKEYFDQFELVLVDETHHAKSMAIKNILEKMTDTKYRFGVTGTLSGMQTDLMVVTGLLGKAYTVTTTEKLQAKKIVSALTINSVVLKYSEEERKLATKFVYVDETDFILSHQKRNKFITNLAIDLPHNTLLLFTFIERHGKILYDLIKEKLEEKGSKRKLFFVSGATDADSRNEIRSIVEKESDAIICASSGCFAEGVNIRNLTNIICAHSTKSRIRVLQQIGRILRTGGNSDHAKVYDIVDDLRYKKYINFSIKHYVERLKMYNEEKFNIKTINLKLT